MLHIKVGLWETISTTFQCSCWTLSTYMMSLKLDYHEQRRLYLWPDNADLKKVFPGRAESCTLTTPALRKEKRQSPRSSKPSWSTLQVSGNQKPHSKTLSCKQSKAIKWASPQITCRMTSGFGGFIPSMLCSVCSQQLQISGGIWSWVQSMNIHSTLHTSRESNT